MDESNIEQKLLNAMGRAMGRFSMLRPGEKVAVAVSGGKDSLSLLHAMVAYRKRAPFPYDLVAVTLEQGKFKLPIQLLGDKIHALGVQWILRQDAATLLVDNHPPGGGDPDLEWADVPTGPPEREALLQRS